ncbi:hypothetical protein [Streptomyces hokutonensis]|uniref:hypothetical protein n=1 Tax=Streptomyces hokutonensis TaxID=1306990 RepID=UPI00381C1836
MDATFGVYNQRRQTFYAVAVDNPSNPTAVQAARWDQKAAAWTWENQKKILNALIEIAPTVIQGVATLLPDGKGKTIVNAVGVAAQSGTLAHETVNAVKNQWEGGAAHPVGASAMVARGAALGFNITAAVLREGRAFEITNKIGTVLSTVAATAMLAKQPSARQVYEQGGNRANLAHDEYELASIEPGWATPQTPNSPSDASLRSREAADVRTTGYSSAVAGPATASRPSAAAVAYTPTGVLPANTPAGTYTPRRPSSDYSTREPAPAPAAAYDGKGKGKDKAVVGRK